MPNKDDIIRLRHILEAALDAISFSQDKTRDSLETDKMFRFSLVRCVEVIGEASSKLSDEFQKEFPLIPWKKIVNMRNRLIHAYYDINLDILWNTIMKDLPPIISEIEKILSSEDNQ